MCYVLGMPDNACTPQHIVVQYMHAVQTKLAAGDHALLGDLSLPSNVADRYSGHLEPAHTLAHEPDTQIIQLPGQERLPVAIWLLHKPATLHACALSQDDCSHGPPPHGCSLPGLQSRPHCLSPPSAAAGAPDHLEEQNQVRLASQICCSILLLLSSFMQDRSQICCSPLAAVPLAAASGHCRLNLQHHMTNPAAARWHRPCTSVHCWVWP